MSILEISHRSKTFEAIIQGCEADMRTLAKIPADYKILFLQGASLQFSMVPMNLLPRRVRRLHRHGGVGAEGRHGSEEGRHRQDRRDDRGGRFQERPQAAGPDPRSRRGVRAHDVQQHDLRDGMALAAGHRRGAARVRHVVGHFQPSDRCREARAHLRGRAEEHGTGRRDARDHPRRHVEEVACLLAHDAELCRARREQSLQHARDGATCGSCAWS